tara:strand:- start:11 stop:628 length:618 start_codon:yes stop_codon:yes gene_type:complete
MNKEEYHKYLKSIEWKNKSKGVKERDRGCCRICNSSLNLEVHHRTYFNIGNEKLIDLITLCKKCHSLFHGFTYESPITYESPKRRSSKKQTPKSSKTTKSSKTIKKLLKKRKYHEEANKARDLILSKYRVGDKVKLDKKMILLCLTFGFGLHYESKYRLLLKQNKKLQNNWQKKLVNTSLLFEDLKFLLQHTKDRELSKILENER